MDVYGSYPPHPPYPPPLVQNIPNQQPYPYPYLPYPYPPYPPSPVHNIPHQPPYQYPYPYPYPYLPYYPPSTPVNNPPQVYDPSISSLPEESEKKLNGANERMDEQMQQAESLNTTITQLGSYVDSLYEEILTSGTNVDIEKEEEGQEKEKELERGEEDLDPLILKELHSIWHSIENYIEDGDEEEDFMLQTLKDFYGDKREEVKDDEEEEEDHDDELYYTWLALKELCGDKREEVKDDKEEEEAPSEEKHDEELNAEEGEEECLLMDMSDKDQESLEAPNEELKSEISISKPLNSSICIAIDTVASVDFILPVVISNQKNEIYECLGILGPKGEQKRKRFRCIDKENLCKRGTREWPNYHKGLLDVETKILRYNGKEDQYPWPFR